MKREYITHSTHGLTYIVESNSGVMYVPVTWKNATEFIKALETAAHNAFGLSLKDAKAYPNLSAKKFHKAFEQVVIKKMKTRAKGHGRGK